MWHCKARHFCQHATHHQRCEMWHCKARHFCQHARHTTSVRCGIVRWDTAFSTPDKAHVWDATKGYWWLSRHPPQSQSAQQRPLKAVPSPSQSQHISHHLHRHTYRTCYAINWWSFKLKQSPEYLTTGQWIMSQMTKVPNKWPQQQHLKICGRERSNMQKRKQIKYTINQSKNNAWQLTLSITPCHTPSLTFQHPSSKFCQNWICHWRGTVYFCSAVHQCCQCPLKGLDTNKTVKITQRQSTHLNMKHVCTG